ncbi:uncharacterized protein LOC106137487 [Amyelois transitella]|uniref:uncharacterized protein LOC106137487 n=1 Tax=Amyelois transitella TaxID=680683 RepID=UPI002990375D|nr:uncharacterized protein LOC106137487 [Amyelois transitella]
MLCRKFRQIFYNKSNWNDNLQHFLISTRFSKKCVSVDGIWALYRGDIKSMSSLRVGWKDLSIMRLLSAWRRSYFVSTVVRRCRRDRGVREVIQRFRHTLLRPRQTLLLSATAAYKSNSGEGDSPPSCEKNITDEELQELLKELESVNDLSKKTLFCTSCGRRLVIDKKQSGVTYCSCKEPKSAEDEDGWIPFMEADDVIVWRKLYKAGQPYYAYKVYGRYKELRAQDFAAVQVDGAYRRVWDSAVASLSVVERQANGVEDQTVLHWEVLWPRLFANRDYVYIRRHKEFDTEREQQPPAAARPERPTVHSNAKRKALEDDGRAMMESGPGNDKVYIIASRSCEHTKVPHSKHAIRVADFWSHMVIKTLDGVDKPGMEFVLTYYEEPAVGGLPSGVATWATGRAAPAFLGRQRRAAAEYRAWRAHRTHQDLPDYIAFGPETEASLDRDAKAAIREQDMESSKQGPDLESDMKTHEKGTQTDTVIAIVEAQEQITTETVSKDGELVTVKSESDKNKHKPVVLEKCNEQINDKAKTDSDSTKNRNTQNSEQKATNGRQEIKNGEHETGNGRQETKNGERETVSGGLESCKSVSGTEIVTQKSGKNKNGEKEKADGRQEIQDGDSKKEERAPEEESSGNSSWWRLFEMFST